jgi:hypothetical protein
VVERYCNLTGYREKGYELGTTTLFLYYTVKNTAPAGIKYVLGGLLFLARNQERIILGNPEIPGLFPAWKSLISNIPDSRLGLGYSLTFLTVYQASVNLIFLFHCNPSDVTLPTIELCESCLRSM